MVAAFFRPATKTAENTSEICPNCGSKLSGAHEWVVREPFTYRPGDGLYVDGTRLKCCQRVHEVIGFIFRAAPNVVSKEAIASAFQYPGGQQIRLIDVYLCQARAAARELGVELPIITRIGLGVAWADQYVVT